LMFIITFSVIHRKQVRFSPPQTIRLPDYETIRLSIVIPRLPRGAISWDCLGEYPSPLPGSPLLTSSILRITFYSSGPSIRSFSFRGTKLVPAGDIRSFPSPNLEDLGRVPEGRVGLGTPSYTREEYSFLRPSDGSNITAFKTTLFSKSKAFLRVPSPSCYFVSACPALLFRGIVLKNASAE
jgi:hypothetical protein